jgi:hypothetical protein
MSELQGILFLPPVMVREVELVLKEAGLGDQSFVSVQEDGRPCFCIDTTGMAISASDDGRDMLINSGALSDMQIALGEDAFIAGWKAACEKHGISYDAGDAYNIGWNSFEPAEDVINFDLEGKS